MSVDAQQLFEAFGFTRNEAGIWRIERSFTNSEDARQHRRKYSTPETNSEDARQHRRKYSTPETNIETTEVIVIVEELEDGRFVGHAQPENPDERGAPATSYCYVSRDPRDMIALAQSEFASGYADATHEFLDEGFASRGFHVSQPFKVPDYFDYGVTEAAKAPHYRLSTPAKAYGSAYAEWRDEFCEKLVAGASPSP